MSTDVKLRRVEPGDYPQILRWQNDPEVFGWMDYDRPFSLADIERSEKAAEIEGVPFVIEARGVAVGRIGLNQFRTRDRIASLYVFVGEADARGKGYAREAIEQILRYGFDALNLRMIQLWMLEGNERAYRLYKSIGFREDGRLRARSFVGGRFLDHIVLSITREELPSRS